jgi:hypothetical protein
MDPARLQRVWIQGYNAQAAVDGAKQIIVAHALAQSMSDCQQLVPLVDAVRANLGRKRREISADAGYCSEDNLLVLATRKIHGCLARPVATWAPLGLAIGVKARAHVSV